MTTSFARRFHEALNPPAAKVSVLDQYQKLDHSLADLQAIRDTMAAAVRPYLCPDCGETFEFTADSTIEDFAELNRWLGYHDRCTEVAEAVGRGQSMLAQAMTAVSR